MTYEIRFLFSKGSFWRLVSSSGLETDRRENVNATSIQDVSLFTMVRLIHETNETNVADEKQAVTYMKYIEYGF